MCGDGVVQPGEECDAGSQNADTGVCKSDCTKQVCGDGYVGPGEGCDDGNTEDGDACTSTCKLATCGDGVVDAGEACDDGNEIDDDACTNKCTLPACGDGVVQAGEACDDGNGDNSDACLATCEAATCGDGFVWKGVEACDDGNMDDTDACTSACQLATCGDGVVQTGEACDGDLAAACPLGTCNPACQCSACGDGYLMGDEQCDDGNQDDADACPTTCVPATCGDGFVWDGMEQCDDGNQDDTDACPTTCVPAYCGDGYVRAGKETCDEGEVGNMSGATCTVDCFKVPTAVVLTTPATDVTVASDYGSAMLFYGTDPSPNPGPVVGFQRADFTNSVGPLVLSLTQVRTTSFEVAAPNGVPTVTHGVSQDDYPVHGTVGTVVLNHPADTEIYCPDDQWLAGISILKGSHIDQVRLHCAPITLTANGITLKYDVGRGAVSDLPWFGGVGGNGMETAMCPDDMIVGKVTVGGDGAHREITLRCFTLGVLQ